MADRFSIDNQKMIYHPDRSAAILAAGDDWEKARSIYPLYVEISPIGACNHRCRFCAVDYIGYKTTRLDADLLIARLQEMGRLGVRAVMYAGEGEPLLHKRISDIAVATSDAGIDVAFTTNATVIPDGFLDEALARTVWLKASINAGHAETYADIHQARPGDFERVLRNLAAMNQARKTHGWPVTLGAQALLLPENAAEMETLARICRDELGLDYLVVKPYSQHLYSKTRHYDGIDYEDFLALEAGLSALGNEGFEVIFRRNTMQAYMSSTRYEKCHATPFVWSYIMADGTVSGCSAFLLDDRFEFGNINKAGFQEIWEGARRRENFHFMHSAMDISACRKSCRMDAVNRYLHQISTAAVPHVNFI
jgi:cyclic pyranopterin phosphate synthase